jgi:hypothetical protein
VSGYVTNPQVIHETIEGETIIIDLASGTYFSLQGSAPAIWNALSQGHNDQQIVSRLQSLYGPEAPELESAVTSFVQELLDCGLVAPGDGAAAEAAAEPVGSEQSEAFAAPRLERYTDMQEIILLDPVHKVDSQGWPNAAPAASASESA